VTFGPRPNILMVIADQLTPFALPYHAHPVTRAPWISWLAERGVVFDNAYTASPLCTPARASLMTGLLPSRTRAYDNAAEFASDIPTFAHYLRSAGYRTVLSGKMHFCGVDQLHGFEERLTTDIYPAGFAWTPDWTRPLERPHWYHDMSSVIEAGPCLRSNQLDFDEEVAFAAQRELYGHLRSDDDRPLFLLVSFAHPHDPYTIPHRWWDAYDDDEIPMPEHGYDAARLHPHEQRLRQVCAMDDVEITEDHVRAARRAYLGEISYVDDQIGRLLEILRQTGTLDDTVVILTSDHGDMQGERGLWYKMSFYEGSVRVPLIVCSPSRFSPRRVATPVSTMDLLPTMVGMAQGGDVTNVVQPLDGESLLPFLNGEHGVRDMVTAEYLAEGAVAPMVMVRHEDLKLIHSPADPDQLFDLSLDPLERRNLVGEPDYADVLAELRTEVSTRWDLPRIDCEVRESQRRRMTVAQALDSGSPTSWDYAPPYDASRRYIRNHLDLGALEALARYPPGSPSPQPEP
jgi:choline-sulfatase